MNSTCVGSLKPHAYAASRELQSRHWWRDSIQQSLHTRDKRGNFAFLALLGVLCHEFAYVAM